MDGVTGVPVVGRGIRGRFRLPMKSQEWSDRRRHSKVGLLERSEVPKKTPVRDPKSPW